MSDYFLNSLLILGKGKGGIKNQKNDRNCTHRERTEAQLIWVLVFTLRVLNAWPLPSLTIAGLGHRRVVTKPYWNRRTVQLLRVGKLSNVQTVCPVERPLQTAWYTVREQFEIKVSRVLKCCKRFCLSNDFNGQCPYCLIAIELLR